MSEATRKEARRGVLAILGACTIWGFAPILYEMLRDIPTTDILAHRILWSLVFFIGVVWFQGRLGYLREAMTDLDQIGWILAAATVISINWFFFVYAIQIGKLSQSSLGYYMSPLVSVVLGYVVFRETLAPLQWAAVAMATLAVSVLTLGLGTAPWLSILLASTFAIYGVMKKKLATGPVISVTAEVALVMPIVALWLVFRSETGMPPWGTLGLLILSGPLTATPLILFSFAAQRIKMTTLGLLLYLNPTLQFLIAALLFGEVMTPWHAITFPMIWLALAIYSGSAIFQERAARKARTSSPTVGVI